MDLPDAFEAVIYSRWSCPTPSGFALGGVYVEIEGLSTRAGFYQRIGNLQRDKQIASPAAV